MCGGGGGSGGDPWGPGGNGTYEANIARDKRNQAQWDADYAAGELAKRQAADAQTKAADVAAFNTRQQAATDTGSNLVKNYFATRGLPYDEGVANSILSSIKQQVPNLDPNPEKYYTDEAIGSLLDTQQAQGTRDRLSNQISSTFAPGFEKTLIGDTADDPFIASILGEQRGTAQKVIDFNKARGLLNDTGYQTAQNTLNTQGTAAQSTLDQIGQSILGKYRQGLSDIRGEAGTAASGYRYGQTAPDIGSYYNRATSKAGEDLAGIEGSIRGAVGGTNYFDAPVALQKGGTMQGPIDLTTQPVAGAPVGTTKKDQGRGLGSSGVF